ncbi:MAG: peptidase [Candidatus Omnitrophica bacterium CG11_big_fil_rev_8_21_14_0_20_64_10]|nr:MAG: peptidase [Candidatus Omnitrophica bacterium CG11_big_fil_rev_8_21_14_0_20_64_10]
MSSFHLTAAALERMIAHCRNDFPNEACGLLAGPAGGGADEAVGMRNTLASPTAFELDPKEQLAVQRRLRASGKGALAIYHSHVASAAYPSPRDIHRATAIQDFFDGHYLLVTLQRMEQPGVRAFKIRDGQVTEVPWEAA